MKTRKIYFMTLLFRFIFVPLEYSDFKYTSKTRDIWIHNFFDEVIDINSKIPTNNYKYFYIFAESFKVYKKIIKLINTKFYK